MADTVEILRKIPAVANLPSWQFDAITEHVEPLKLKKGTKLIKRGSDDGYTYFLSVGKVSLECDDSPPVVVEANAESLRTPLANLRPRIVDVKAMGRGFAIRVPDILLNPIGCSDSKIDPEQAAVATADHEHPSFETRLQFELYSDLANDQTSILRSLPYTADRIRRAIENDAGDAEAVARLVATDAAIAAKLVKTANNAPHRGRSPVTTLTAAIDRLGLEATRNLVQTFAIKEVIRTTNKRLRQRMTDLWEHSTFIAATCFVLARETKRFNAQEALLVGLVHEIGAIAVINYAARDPQLASDLEGLERAISCMCGELGALMLRRWEFAPEICVAVQESEYWLREHDEAADFTDLLIVAHVHERLRNNQTEGLPRFEDIPAFSKLLGTEVSPNNSLMILRQAEAVVDQLSSALRR